MIKAGRPKKRGELTEKRKEVYFKQSEWEEILEKLPVGSKPGVFIRETVLNAIKSMPNEANSEISETISKPSDDYNFSLPAHIRKRFKELADEVGFDEVSLAQELSRTAALRPDEAQIFLFGEEVSENIPNQARKAA